MILLMRFFSYIILFTLILISSVIVSCNKDKDQSLIDTGLVKIADNLKFAEGPAYYSGDLYFSDIDADKIYKWNETDGLIVFRGDAGRANGLCFDKNGNLFVCEGGNKRIVSINLPSELNIISEKYSNKPYNEPNDIWVSPSGNIYFTDPVFTGTLSQDGEHVYCVPASGGQAIRVADDLVRPNGITGNIEGSILYISDYGDSKIYRYNILPDGTLTSKQLFAAIKADGLDTDSSGNIYAASDGIIIYNSSGGLINRLQVPGTTTNSCIVEEGTKTLFITTHNTVYKYIIN